MSFFKSTAYRYHEIRSAISATRRTPGSPAGREAGVLFAQAKSMTVGLSGAAVRYAFFANSHYCIILAELSKKFLLVILPS